MLLRFRIFSKMVESSALEINSNIVTQGNLIRELKAKKADKAAIGEAVKVLLALKADFKVACGIDWKPGVEVPSSEIDNVPGETKVLDGNPSSAIEINSKIVTQGNLIRELKAKKADKAEIGEAVKVLLALKADFKAACGIDWKPDVEVPSSKKDNVQGETVVLDGNPSIDVVNALKDAAAEGLDIKIKTCGDLIRRLKLENTGKEVIEQEVKVLLLLKDLYKEKTGHDWKPQTSPPKQMKPQVAQVATEGYEIIYTLARLEGCGGIQNLKTHISIRIFNENRTFITGKNRKSN